MWLMESPGKYLKAERESQNLSLKEVSESTKIRELLLKALEEDQYELISSPVYVKGFIDAYARYLGLDSNNIILQYQQNYGNTTPSKKPRLKQPKTSPSLKQWITFSKRRITRWHVIIAIFVMILLIAMVTYLISLKSRHGSLRLPEDGSALTPEPPVPSPSPIQEEPDTETTSPSPPPTQEEGNTEITSPPKKVEPPQPMDSKKNRGAKAPGRKRATKKSEGDR
jgi:cytoskeleton protein RodZ